MSPYAIQVLNQKVYDLKRDIATYQKDLASLEEQVTNKKRWIERLVENHDAVIADLAANGYIWRDERDDEE